MRLLLHGCHKKRFGFLQKLPDTTENFQRLENLFENRKLPRNNTASPKNYCITANYAKIQHLTVKCVKTRHYCKFSPKYSITVNYPKNTSLQKCNKKTARKDSFLRIQTIFFVQQHCNACALAFTISVLSTFWAKGSATAGRFPTCPEALLRKAQFWTKANTCSNPTQRCRRQGLCCSDRTPLPLCLLQ